MVAVFTSEGDVFVALQGETHHGLEFVESVAANKAAAILVTSEDPQLDAVTNEVLSDVALIEVENLAANTGEIVSRSLGAPTAKLTMVGVTGTDGKTSVCHMVAQALNGNKSTCGVMGTLGYGFPGALAQSALTTPDPVFLQQALASSHALAQERVGGIDFDVAVLTNLGRDHLDYHGDLQSYRDAKRLLFLKPQLRAAAINADDDFGATLLEQLPQLDVYSYGAEANSGQHIRYKNVKQSSAGLCFELEYGDKVFPVQSHLLGAFNVQNLAATFAVLLALGVSAELAARSLHDLTPVPGRMQTTHLANGAVVIVDYAHNPHALESVLSTVAEHCSGNLTVVFGCGGDRDQGKRPIMAQVAERYCDACFVTDDNPRGESGNEIIDQILTGFSATDKVIVERDRKTAIERAVNNAGHNDFVVVAGKGHEDYQIVGDQRLHFSDSEVVAELALALEGVAV